MSLRSTVRRLETHPAIRMTMVIVGAALMLIAPLAGLLPGPGGIIVFAIGLALVLRSSLKARRLYARAMRRRPRLRGAVNWGMRRRSHLRRTAQKSQKIVRE